MKNLTGVLQFERARDREREHEIAKNNHPTTSPGEQKGMGEGGLLRGCWIFEGPTSHGYGRIPIPGQRGKRFYVHRLAYWLAKGPIPIGFVIDHLCNERLCWNPAHLEAVTDAENQRRERERKGVGEYKRSAAPLGCGRVSGL